MARLPTTGPRPSRERLADLYTAQRLSLRQCAKVLSVTSTCVGHWLKQEGIPRRSVADAKRGQKPAPQTVEASVKSRRKRVLPGRPAVGYKLRSDGYVDIWIPETQSYKKEHRLVAEKVLGRELKPGEDVHHRNERPAENVPENLEVLTHSQHLRRHYADRQIDPLTGRFLGRNAKVEPSS